jgi:hypothetical protein
MNARPIGAASSQAGTARAHWLRNQHQTHATALLSAMGGSDERVAQAMQALGPGRLSALIDGGELQVLLRTLSVPDHVRTLNDPRSGPADRYAAMAALRAAAGGYAAQAKATEALARTVGQPERFPPEIYAPGPPKPNPIEVFAVQKEATYKVLGGMADRTVERFVYEPWQRFVAQPTARGAMEMYSRFQSTPVGQHFEVQKGRAAGVLRSVVGEDTPVGNALRLFDQAVVRNERLWAGLDKAGAIGRKLVVGAAATTAAILANAYRTGTLQTGTFNTSGKLTPAQMQMVKGINIPPNMNVRFFTVPTTIPVTVRGQVFNVKAAATMVVAEGSNVLFLPALGPGKPGAQPWVGPVQDGGRSGTEKQLVAASSSVAAAGWGLVGFNIGTDNFNIGGRADVQAGRGLLNTFAAQFKRQDAPPGQPRGTLQTIVIADLLSTFHSATINVGPLAVVVDRVRVPQNERFTFPNGANPITLNRDARRSSVQPAIPATGSGTFNPEAEDVKAFLALFGAPPNAHPTKP